MKVLMFGAGTENIIRFINMSDLHYMSWQQVRALDEMEVILVEENGKRLIVENY